MPAGSRTDPLLAKAEPIRNDSNASVMTYSRGRKNSYCAVAEGSERVALGQGDLLKNAKNEALENMKQIQLACLSCGLSKTGSGHVDPKSKRSLEAIQEKDTGDENGRL
ncbi:hypothetical protein BTVI_45879 [Pitangus sulphuratus]|nr:hypothetical protein BTVI_45879 [Pitangus sulphuratus]